MTTHKDVMIEAAKAAGEIGLRYFWEGGKVEQKEDGSHVSIADTEMEKEIIRILREQFPYAVIAEESGALDADSEYSWVIDPIDGTGNFVMGLSNWCTSIALMKGDTPVAGLIYVPLTDQVFFSEENHGFHRRESEARHYQFDPAHGSQATQFFSDVAPLVDQNVSWRFIGSAAFAITTVATGGARAFLGRGQDIWDVAAAVLLAKESGCIVSDWSGDPWDLEKKELLIASPDEHARIVSLLRKD